MNWRFSWTRIETKRHRASATPSSSKARSTCSTKLRRAVALLRELRFLEAAQYGMPGKANTDDSREADSRRHALCSQDVATGRLMVNCLKREGGVVSPYYECPTCSRPRQQPTQDQPKPPPSSKEEK